MREFWKEYGPYVWLVVVILLFLFAFLINYHPYLYNYMHSTLECDASVEVNSWFSFLSGGATAILAVVAWFKFGGFHEQNQANFLLRIDERWGNPEAIKARTIIHKLYLQVQEENQNTLLHLEHAIESRETYIPLKIGEKIIEWGKKFEMKEDFIYLLNFLDFMETIGYLESKNHVTVDELEALCGESLMFNYKIFKPYIEDKRDRHQNDEFYKNFDSLYQKLEERSKAST